MKEYRNAIKRSCEHAGISMRTHEPKTRKELSEFLTDRDISNRVELGYVRIHQCTDQYKLWGNHGVSAHKQLSDEKLVVEDIRSILDEAFDPAKTGVCYLGVTEIEHATDITPDELANAYFMKTGEVLEWLVIVNRYAEMDDYGIGGVLVAAGSPFVYSSAPDGSDGPPVSAPPFLVPSDFEYLEEYNYRHLAKKHLYKGEMLEKFERPFVLCQLAEEILANFEYPMNSFNALLWELRGRGYAGWRDSGHSLKPARTDLLAALSCGMYEQNSLRWVKNYRYCGRKMKPFLYLMDNYTSQKHLAERAGYEKYRKMAKACEDICWMWEEPLHSIYHKFWAGEAIDGFWEDIEEGVENTRGNEKQLSIILGAIAAETGVAAKMKAYANGVPLDDIEIC